MKYGQKKIYKYEIIVNLLVTLLCVVSFVIGKRMGEDVAFLDQFIIGGSIGIFSVIILLARDHLLYKIKIQEKGLRGEKYLEKKIEEELDKDSYRVIIGKRNSWGGDMDIILICRHGVYCVEVKNISGAVKYDCENDKLLVGKFEKKFLQQVRGNAREIQIKLSEAGEEIDFVHSVLVMSGCTLVDINEEIKHGTRIYYPKNFIEYINKQNLNNTGDIDIDRIYKILK